jgi:hypothetical protein
MRENWSNVKATAAALGHPSIRMTYTQLCHFLLPIVFYADTIERYFPPIPGRKSECSLELD